MRSSTSYTADPSTGALTSRGVDVQASRVRYVSIQEWGEGVTHLQPGQPVCALTGSGGGYAEYAVAEAEATISTVVPAACMGRMVTSCRTTWPARTRNSALAPIMPSLDTVAV